MMKWRHRHGQREDLHQQAWLPRHSGCHYVHIDEVAAADEVDAADFDAVIVPGGYAPDRMRRYESILKLVREADEQGKVVAAICHAGWVLPSAGILKGRRATCVSAIKDATTYIL